MQLNESNYFSPEAEMHYMGSTQIKRFNSCESQALAILRGEYRTETSTALLVGSYVDAHFSGTLDLFRAQNPEIFKRDGSLKSDYEQANYIIARIERDEVFMAAVSGQSQVIMTGDIEGVPVKIKVDCLLPDRIVDMKVMKDMADVWKNGAYVEFWDAWDYPVQGAIYREVVRQNTGKTLDFMLAVATKEKPEPDIDIIKISHSRLDVALDEVRANIVYFDGLKKGLYEPQGCGKCPWCRSRKVLRGFREVG